MVSTTTQDRVDRNTDGSVDRGSQSCCEPELHVLDDLQCYTKKYIQQRPEAAALFCLGIGFVLGWKIKPW